MSGPRIAQAEALLAAFGWDVEHSRQVRDLAVQLFDQLRPLHGLDRDARDLLQAAALLHDIGWTIAGRKHHKHSAQLIRQNRHKLPAFSPPQVELIANVARYHRKAPPAAHHSAFAALSEADRDTVRKLAALLRLADGLDRPHLQQVRRLRCEIGDRAVHLRVEVTVQIQAHLEGAARKQQLFEEVFGRRLEVSADVPSSAVRSLRPSD
jgi:exopolyphosphatase/guanosine-5'-triphosphate,3'-diphosphate pyrophosphatase